MYNNMSNLEHFLITIIIVISMLIYFAPTIITSRKRDLMFIINLFVGATVIGWGVCLWFAFYTQFENKDKRIYIKRRG